MRTFKEIDLIQGEKDRTKPAAFTRQELGEVGADNDEFAEFIAMNLKPISIAIGRLMTDNSGFGIIREGDDILVVGFKIDE